MVVITNNKGVVRCFLCDRLLFKHSHAKLLGRGAVCADKETCFVIRLGSEILTCFYCGHAIDVSDGSFQVINWDVRCISTPECQERLTGSR